MPNFTLSVSEGSVFVSGVNGGRGNLVVPVGDLHTLAQALTGAAARAASDSQLAQHAALGAAPPSAPPLSTTAPEEK